MKAQFNHYLHAGIYAVLETGFIGWRVRVHEFPSMVRLYKKRHWSFDAAKADYERQTAPYEAAKALGVYYDVDYPVTCPR